VVVEHAEDGAIAGVVNGLKEAVFLRNRHVGREVPDLSLSLGGPTGMPDFIGFLSEPNIMNVMFGSRLFRRRFSHVSAILHPAKV
jgi:hypothetical protein